MLWRNVAVHRASFSVSAPLVFDSRQARAEVRTFLFAFGETLGPKKTSCYAEFYPCVLITNKATAIEFIMRIPC